jgi:ubiquitin-conjugating enzyme E2 M
MSLTTDLTELELPNTMKMEFPDPTNVLSFNLTLTPDEGKSGLLFLFKIMIWGMLRQKPGL